jgi:hypothetical protein
LLQLKFNLGISDISTFGLFRVSNDEIRSILYHEKVRDVLGTSDSDASSGASDIKLLFQSWIYVHHGAFAKEALQLDVTLKQPTGPLWLAFMEASFMTTSGSYYLTEEEAIMLGCLRTQVLRVFISYPLPFILRSMLLPMPG